MKLTQKNTADEKEYKSLHWVHVSINISFIINSKQIHYINQ